MGFINYIKDVRAELRHVSWPSRKQTIIYTTLVILISLFVSFYIGVFDYVFTNIINKLI